MYLHSYIILYYIKSLEDPGVDVRIIQGGSNMTGTDLCVNKPHCAAAVQH